MSVINKRRWLADNIRSWCKDRGCISTFERVEKPWGVLLAIRINKGCIDHLTLKVEIKPGTDINKMWFDLRDQLESRFSTSHDGLKAVKYTIDEMHDYSGTSGYNVFLSKRFNAPTPDPIKKVIFNPPATIVLWNDGTKTVVKCTDEEFDPEKGLAMAISKKLLGNKGNYYKTFKKYLPKVWTNDDINSIYPESIKLDISAGASDFSKHVTQMTNSIYGYKNLYPCKKPSVRYGIDTDDVEIWGRYFTERVMDGVKNTVPSFKLSETDIEKFKHALETMIPYKKEDIKDKKHDKILKKVSRLKSMIAAWCNDEELDYWFKLIHKSNYAILEIHSSDFITVSIAVKEVTKLNKAFDYFCREVDRRRKDKNDK